MSQHLTRNAARCLICDEVIESRHRHDFVACRGRHFFIDGGLDYASCGTLGPYDVDDLQDLSVYAADEAVSV